MKIQNRLCQNRRWNTALRLPRQQVIDLQCFSCHLVVSWLSSVNSFQCLQSSRNYLGCFSGVHWFIFINHSLPHWSSESYEGSPACLLYSSTSITSGTQMGSVAAKCIEAARSFMTAEKAGRSLKLHIQQYLIRSYLKIETDLVSVSLAQETLRNHFSATASKVLARGSLVANEPGTWISCSHCAEQKS